MNHLDPTIMPLIVLCAVAAAGWLVMVVVLALKTRRDRHESRVQQRLSQLLAQEYEQLLTPEERQRREAQRRHLAELRARAEAELAAEAASRGKT
jgi:hypothetical protein